MSAAFPGILVYLVLWLIMPKQPYSIAHDSAYQSQGYKNPVRTVNQDKRDY